MAGKSDQFDRRAHRRRRHGADRLHLGHHRRAQGHDALPPRRDGRLRLLAAACAAAGGRRCLHRQPAAGLHLRAGRSAAVPDERGRQHGADRKGHARRAAAGHRAATAPRCCFTAPTSLPRDGGACGRARPVAAAAQMCLGRRGAARRHARAVAGGHRHRASSTASAPPRCCTSSSRPTKTHARPGATGVPVPGYVAAVLDDDGQPGATRHRGQARGEGPDRLPLPGR